MGFLTATICYTSLACACFSCLQPSVGNQSPTVRNVKVTFTLKQCKLLHQDNFHSEPHPSSSRNATITSSAQVLCTMLFGLTRAYSQLYLKHLPMAEQPWIIPRLSLEIWKLPLCSPVLHPALGNLVVIKETSMLLDASRVGHFLGSVPALRE